MQLQPEEALRMEGEGKAVEAEVVLVVDAGDQEDAATAAAPRPAPTSRVTTAAAKATTLVTVLKAPSLSKNGRRPPPAIIVER